MRIEVNASAVLGKVMKLKNGLDDVRPFFEKAKVVLEEAKDKQFAYEGSYLDKKWKPLMPSTLARKRGASILVETGKLKASFGVKEQSKKRLVYGSTSDYYAFHQLGTRKMARRTILNVNTALEREITSLFREYLITVLYG
jgi:phage gpG-like protein